MNLPHYQSPSNGVYIKLESIPSSKGLINLNKVILLGYYITPTEKTIINYLQQVAQKISESKGLHLPPGLSLGQTTLEQALLALPVQNFDHIQHKYPQCVTFLRANTPAPYDNSEPQLCLQIKCGYIPPRLNFLTIYYIPYNQKNP